MTRRTIIKKVKAMLLREWRAYQRHAREMRGSCLSSCEDLQRWHAANGILQDVLRLLGARIPAAVRGVKEEQQPRTRRATLKRLNAGLDPKKDPIVVGVVDDK